MLLNPHDIGKINSLSGSPDSSSILNRIDNLYTSVNEMEKQLALLTEKLNPILNPALKTNSVEEKKEKTTSSHSEVFNKINSINDKLLNLFFIVGNINDRINL